MDQFDQLLLDAIVPSKTNPRKNFNAEALNELAQSIRATGVHQPILVRPLPAHRLEETSTDPATGKPPKVRATHELVCGERRFRASKLAGCQHIPALIRHLADDAVLEIQIVENLQRDDLTELEEAEGYEALMTNSALLNVNGITIDQLAAKIGKSKSYVYSRLKLLDLCQEARSSLRDHQIDASRALLVARIPDHKLQIKAMKEIVSGEYGLGGIKEPMTYRTALAHLQRNYMLKLSEATFNIKSTDLVPDAGSCKTCTKRTGNDPDLFSDVKGADICTDPPCFHRKAEATTELMLQRAHERGMTAIAGREALELRVGHDKFKGYRRLDHVDDSPTDATLRTIIGTLMVQKDIKPVLIEHASKKGKMVECLPNDVALSLLKEVEKTPAKSPEVAKEVKQLVKDKREKAAAKAKAQYESRWREALLSDTWEGISDDAFDIDVHRYLVARAAANLTLPHAEAICALLELGKVSPFTAVRDFAKETQHPSWLHMLIVMQKDSSANEVGHVPTPNEGLMLIASKVFGSKLPAHIESIKARLQAAIKADLAPSPGDNSSKGGRGPGAKGPATASRKLLLARAASDRVREAEQGIASAMQDIEGGPVARPTEPADVLYEQALAIVIKQQVANVRLLKTELKVGAERAMGLLDLLQAAGKVSACPREGGVRKVLVAA